MEALRSIFRFAVRMARSFVHVEDGRHHVGVKMEKRGLDHGHKADFHILAKLDPASFSTTLTFSSELDFFWGAHHDST
jgi:hypothetical protein